MNPVFYILIFVGVISIWFLLTCFFKPFGKFLSTIWKDTVKTMTDDIDNKKEKETKTNE